MTAAVARAKNAKVSTSRFAGLPNIRNKRTNTPIVVTPLIMLAKVASPKGTSDSDNRSLSKRTCASKNGKPLYSAPKNHTAREKYAPILFSLVSSRERGKIAYHKELMD